MGYGRKILQLGLVKAQKIGLTKVLVTCDETNSGSQKIIESCGGVLENIVQQNESRTKKKRYWIQVEK